MKNGIFSVYASWILSNTPRALFSVLYCPSIIFDTPTEIIYFPSTDMSWFSNSIDFVLSWFIILIFSHDPCRFDGSGMVFLITIGFSFKSDQDIDSALIRRWSSSSHFSLRDILLFTPVEHLRDRISLICFLPFIFVFHLAFNHFPDICSLFLYSVPLTK